jgi:hypothetical protein
VTVSEDTLFINEKEGSVSVSEKNKEQLMEDTANAFIP